MKNKNLPEFSSAPGRVRTLFGYSAFNSCTGILYLLRQNIEDWRDKKWLVEGHRRFSDRNSGVPAPPALRFLLSQ